MAGACERLTMRHPPNLPCARSRLGARPGFWARLVGLLLEQDAGCSIPQDTSWRPVDDDGARRPARASDTASADTMR